MCRDRGGDLVLGKQRSPTARGQHGDGSQPSHSRPGDQSSRCRWTRTHMCGPRGWICLVLGRRLRAKRAHPEACGRKRKHRRRCWSGPHLRVARSRPGELLGDEQPRSARDGLRRLHHHHDSHDGRRRGRRHSHRGRWLHDLRDSDWGRGRVLGPGQRALRRPSTTRRGAGWSHTDCGRYQQGVCRSGRWQLVVFRRERQR